jgi:hypothetical protein
MSLMDVLGGGPGGPPGPPGPLGGGGPPPDAGPPPDTGGGDGGPYDNSLQALDVAEHALQAFMQMDHDMQDKAQAARALTIVASLKGANQADAQKGGGKSLVRALGGAPSPLAGLGG